MQSLLHDPVPDILLTNPLNANIFFKLWREEGFKIPELLHGNILATDEEFDNFVARSLSSQSCRQVLVDPVFNKGEQVGGFRILNAEVP